MTFKLLSPGQLSQRVAARAAAARLAANFPQAGLTARSGVSLASLRRFEQTGKISLDGLIQIAFALDAVDGFAGLFPEADPRSIEEVIAPKRRQRGRRA